MYQWEVMKVILISLLYSYTLTSSLILYLYSAINQSISTMVKYTSYCDMYKFIGKTSMIDTKLGKFAYVPCLFLDRIYQINSSLLKSCI